MERKKALVAASLVSATLFAASTGFAIRGGVLDARARDGAGQLTPVAAAVQTTPSATTSGAGAFGREREDDERSGGADERGRHYAGADDDD